MYVFQRTMTVQQVTKMMDEKLKCAYSLPVIVMQDSKITDLEICAFQKAIIALSIIKTMEEEL